MKQRLLIVPFLLLAWVLASAQSPAAMIKEIQKNPNTYINAESTSPSEEEAYANALRQLTDMAVNFVDANADGAGIDEASIESLAERITIPKGDFHRVFLFVSREDLLAKSHPVLLDDIADSSQSSGAADMTSSDPVSEELQAALNEVQPEDVEIYIPEEVNTAVISQTKVTGMAGQMINDILRAKDLKEAVKIVNDYKDMRVVVDYGVARDAHDSSSSFWVVEDPDGGLAVLGPEINGYRSNYKTDKADALYRYSKGMWFRKR